MCSVVLSGLAFADQSDNPFVYEEEPLEVTAVGDAPAAPGDPGAVPIDQYIPFLLIAAAAITFTYGRRKRTA
nr:hypothetical protein [uncultured Chryseobacterium sp.]